MPARDTFIRKAGYVIEIKRRQFVSLPLNNGLRFKLRDLVTAVTGDTILAGQTSISANGSIPHITAKEDISLEKVSVRLIGRTQEDLLGFYVRIELTKSGEVDLIGIIKGKGRLAN